MHTIVGLGNPGDEYIATRHNAGRIVLAGVLRKLGWSNEELSGKCLGKLISGRIAEKPVQVLFPDTYMNESGKSVRKLVPREDVKDLIVIYDEIDLPLGEFKISHGRGDGGHNGLSSVIAAVDTKDFVRIRIGIAHRNFWGKVVRPEGEKLARYVLGRLSRGELAKLQALEEDVSEALEMIVEDGVEKAMNRFN